MTYYDTVRYAASAVLGVAATVYSLAWAYLYLTHHRDEPPFPSATIPIPFIGTIIDMRKKRSRFPLYMKTKFPDYPIYKVRVPGRTFYYVNSLPLIPAIQKQVHTLSFDPTIINGLRTLLDVSPDGMAIMSRDLGTDRNFLPRLHKAVHGALAAGPELNVMSAHTVGLLERTLSDLAGRGTTPVKLYDWMRRNVMVATTNTIFGPMDPFQHPANIDAWIEFETNGISALGMGLPKWMVREAVKARETLFVAFDEYFRRGGLAQASTFFQRRIEFYRAEQIPQGDINRLAVADNIAFSTNLLPTAFWLIYHIYSDPECLRLCRTELESGVTRDGESSQVISYGYIKESCPTLQAVLRESFRFHGFGFAPRVALEDHMLDGRFLIKKGGYVFTPYIVQHRDPQNWGADVDEFRFQRFLPGEDGKRLKHHPAALRGFGYGAHLCPGRHFATAELLLLCALMTLRFDLKPAGGSEWPQLSVHKSLQVAALEQPDQDVEVVFHPREGVNQNGWSVRMA